MGNCRITLTLTIDEDIKSKMDKVSKNNGIKCSTFISRIVTEYFNNKLTELHLNDNIEKKFNNYDGKEYLPSNLITEYFNNNIVFVDQIQKVNSLFANTTFNGTLERTKIPVQNIPNDEEVGVAETREHIKSQNNMLSQNDEEEDDEYTEQPINNMEEDYEEYSSNTSEVPTEPQHEPVPQHQPVQKKRNKNILFGK